MAKNQYPVPKSNPNMMMVVAFFLMLFTNAIVISLANQFFPNLFVLGTMSLTYYPALLLSSGMLALITVLAIPFFTQWEMTQQKILTPMQWMGGYLVINFIGLWLIARGAEVFGLGIASWLAVLGLAVVLDFMQGMVMMALGKSQEKK